MTISTSYIDEDSNENSFDLYHSPTPVSNPEVSVVVSTYNRMRSEGDCECLLKRALDSILNQTFTNFELILIDDFSKDATKEYCIQVAKTDPRIFFYHFKANSGKPAKRYNFGMSKSRANYMAFMFDDDKWELNALKDLHEGIETRDSHCAMVYGAADYYGENMRKFDSLGGKWQWRKINQTNFISNNGVIVKKSAIDVVGGYDEDPVFSRVCDWDLWWRIGRQFRVGRIENKVANVYSLLPDSIGCLKVLNFDKCKRRQRQKRTLPLQKTEGTRSNKIQATIFDICTYLQDRVLDVKSYLSSDNIKLKIKKNMPDSFYVFLKKSNSILEKIIGMRY